MEDQWRRKWADICRVLVHDLNHKITLTLDFSQYASHGGFYSEETDKRYEKKETVGADGIIEAMAKYKNSWKDIFVLFSFPLDTPEEDKKNKRRERECPLFSKAVRMQEMRCFMPLATFRFYNPFALASELSPGNIPDIVIPI